MAKKNIVSATAVQKRFKQLDTLQEEVETLRQEVAELRSTLSLLAGGKLPQSEEASRENLGKDTWDPSKGRMPKEMRPAKRFNIAVKRREDVKTVQKGGYE